MTETKRVLVIDDEDSVRAMVEAALSHAGYTVLCAENGAEGLKVLDSQKFDLVITDILMPEKEGVETIVEIRQKTPDLRIIAMSGGGRVHNMEPLKIAGGIGADVLLPKPFDRAKLLGVVKSVLLDGSTRAASGETAS